MRDIESNRCSISDLAHRLFLDPAERDLLGEPVPVGPAGASPDEIRRVLDAVTSRIGRPTHFGGSSAGPSIRWRTKSHTVILDTCDRDRRLQVSVRRTWDLEDAEAAAFRRRPGEGRAPLTPYRDLPYLWQWQPTDSASPPPPAPPAPNWAQLSESLEGLLLAWSEQLEVQLHTDAGFDIVIGGVGPTRRLITLVGPEEDVHVLVDDPVTEGAHGAEMNSRGWQEFVPLLRWWEAHFARTAAGAREAANLIVSEAQKRGARDPGDLLLADVRVEAESPGRLSLPGLGIASPA